MLLRKDSALCIKSHSFFLFIVISGCDVWDCDKHLVTRLRMKTALRIVEPRDGKNLDLDDILEPLK